MQLVLQYRGPAQIEREGRGPRRACGGAPREPLLELFVAPRPREQLVDLLRDACAGTVRLGAAQRVDRAREIASLFVDLRDLAQYRESRLAAHAIGELLERRHQLVLSVERAERLRAA